MQVHAAILLTKMADVSLAGQTMRAYVTPIVLALGGLASLVAVFFLVVGGFHYMTSSGKPERLEYAKKVIRNALIGLVVVLGAGVLTALLSHAYTQSSAGVGAQLPALTAITPTHTPTSLVDVFIKAITGVLAVIVESIGAPFMKALTYFTSATPLMASNPTVFNLWLAIVGMADALFVLVVGLLGFHVMSAATLGLDEIEFKHLLPQIGLCFLLLNTSIFVIDGVIGLSNGMIAAIRAGFGQTSVWTVLSGVAAQSGGLGLAALIIMIVFLILSVILLVYYVGRLVTLYIGAALSPLVLLLWLVPSFKDFALSAAKAYVATVFVLFVHVVILLLAASIFAGLIASSPNHTPDPIMALIVGLAVVVALLKTQGVLMQLSYVSLGPRTARRLGSQFVNGVAYVSQKTRASAGDSSSQRPRASYPAFGMPARAMAAAPPLRGYRPSSVAEARAKVAATREESLKPAANSREDKP